MVNVVSPAKTSKKPTEKMVKNGKNAEDKGDANAMDKLNEEIRFAIWPNYDYEKFVQAIEDWPELMTSKHGSMQETLLHR